MEQIVRQPHTALTEKTMSSPIFSLGRYHVYFGRLLNPTVDYLDGE
jgi:hypothetical protein